MELVEALTLAANAATALGVGMAAWQLRLSKSQSRTDFEDGLTTQFRDILKDIPPRILLGDDVEIDIDDPCFISLYRYIDLCNEQVFLRMMKRVSKETWINWRDGIDGMMRLPGLARAWMTIRRRLPSRFSELAAFGADGLDQDPAEWPEAKSMRWERFGLISRDKRPPLERKGDLRWQISPKGIRHPIENRANGN